MKNNRTIAAVGDSVMPSALTVNFIPGEKHTDVQVNVFEELSFFLTPLKCGPTLWNKTLQVFEGAGADVKNSYLNDLKGALAQVYTFMVEKGDVTSAQLVKRFKLENPHFVIESIAKNDYKTLRRKLSSELANHQKKAPGKVAWRQVLHEKKETRLVEEIKELDVRIAQQVAIKRKRVRRGLKIGSIKVRFVLLKNRLNKEGRATLQCRVRVNGIAATPFSTKIMTSPNDWDAKQQCIIGNPLDTAILTTMRDGIINTHNDLRKRGKITSVELVLDHYFNNVDFYDESMTLQELFEAHAENKKKSVGKSAILKRMRVCELYLEFSKQRYVKEVKPIHIRGFLRWLIHIKGLSNDYSNKLIQSMYSPFQLAVEHEVISQNPTAELGLEWEHKLNLTSLDNDELDRLKSAKFSPVHQRVADIFLFMCYSGLHIGDYLALTEDNIKSNSKVKWIEYSRKKTDRPAMIPLHPVVSALIRKYGSVANLPRMSAQRINDHLKIIATKIGTDKDLTNKVARKTFTDMSINARGMSFEAVAGMLGHSSTKFVQVYGKVRHQRILSEWKA